MSKWAVLKAAISGKGDETARNASIHRHDGFSPVLNRKRIFWQWKFTHRVGSTAAAQVEILQHLCAADLARADSAEVKIIFYVKESLGPSFLSMLQGLEQRDDVMWRVQEVEWIKLKKSNGKRGKKSRSTHEKLLQVAVFYHDRCFEPVMQNHELCAYSIPSASTLSATCVYTREAAKRTGVQVTAKGLISHLLHGGVDNTGNVRVWTSEFILLRTLLTPHYATLLKNKSVLELGGGMTALCGLGLSLLSECGPITTTDGHPDCVLNQNVCIELCRQKHPDIFKARRRRHSEMIQARLLRWSLEDKTGDLRILTTPPGEIGDTYPTFDVIIASDCLFFKDFHRDLYWLLKNASVPGSIVLLLQPPRSGTLELFLDIVRTDGCFRCERSENYLPEVTELHRTYLDAAIDKSYDPDVHFPVLITLTRL